MKKQRLIPFSMMPAAWGLKGRSYRIAEAEYYYEGEELERQLLLIKYGPADTRYQIASLALDLKYGHLDAYEHDRRLAEIECLDQKALDIAYLDIQHKYGYIDAYEYDLGCAALDHLEGSVDAELANLDIDLKHGRISETQHAKETATLRKEPWVGVLESGFDPEQGVSGLYFELDWNRQWIDQLIEVGYRGNSEQEIIDVWFADVCRSHTEATIYNNIVPFGM